MAKTTTPAPRCNKTTGCSCSCIYPAGHDGDFCAPPHGPEIECIAKAPAALEGR